MLESAAQQALNKEKLSVVVPAATASVRFAD